MISLILSLLLSGQAEAAAKPKTEIAKCYEAVNLAAKKTPISMRERVQKMRECAKKGKKK